MENNVMIVNYPDHSSVGGSAINDVLIGWNKGISANVSMGYEKSLGHDLFTKAGDRVYYDGKVTGVAEAEEVRKNWQSETSDRIKFAGYIHGGNMESISFEKFKEITGINGPGAYWRPRGAYFTPLQMSEIFKNLTK